MPMKKPNQITMSFPTNLDVPSEVQALARELVIQGLDQLTNNRIWANLTPQEKELINAMLAES